MTHTTTHLVPVELAPQRPAPLHFHYAGLVGQALVVALLTLIITALSLTSHYGDDTTLNQGYVMGSETGTLELGIETVGSPGVFGHLTTPLGTLSYYGEADGARWCPTGSDDVDCAA